MRGTTNSRHDPVEDQAAALFHVLETHKSTEPRIAQPMERLAARLIDVCIWLALGMAWSIVAFYVDTWFFDDPLGQPGPFGEPPTPVERIDPLVSWLAFAGLVVSVWAAEALPTARHGRHFSKKRLKLWVVGPAGRPPGLRRATVRWLAWWLPAFGGLVFWGATFGTGWGFLGIAIQLAALAVPGAMLADDAHRGLHDRLAGTQVLVDRQGHYVSSPPRSNVLG